MNSNPRTTMPSTAHVSKVTKTSNSRLLRDAEPHPIKWTLRPNAARLLQRGTTGTLAVSRLPRYTAAMGKVEKIEQQIQSLSPEEMTELREWFAAFDAEAWDRQF